MLSVNASFLCTINARLHQWYECSYKDKNVLLLAGDKYKAHLHVSVIVVTLAIILIKLHCMNHSYSHPKLFGSGLGSQTLHDCSTQYTLTVPQDNKTTSLLRCVSTISRAIFKLSSNWFWDAVVSLPLGKLCCAKGLLCKSHRSTSTPRLLWQETVTSRQWQATVTFIILMIFFLQKVMILSFCLSQIMPNID